MQLNNTKKNHYVPKFYLKNFADENENIYLFDKKTRKFHSTKDLRSIAFKTNLYTITNKISKNDIDLFCKIFRVSIDTKGKKFFFDVLQSFLNDEFTKLFTIENKNEYVEKVLHEMLDSPDLSRNQELLFSLYEKDFMPVLSNIIKHNEMLLMQKNESDIKVYLFNKIISFILKKMQQKMVQSFKSFDSGIKDKITPILSASLSFQNSYYDLLHYILIQYLRTTKIMSNIVDGLKSIFLPIFNIGTAHNIMFLLIHYQVLYIANNLIQQNYKIVLLKNYTEKLFFTSDNPSINTHGEFIKDFGIDGIGYEIFFPLSPKLALLVTNTPSMFSNYNKQKSEIIIDKEEQIYSWNKFLFNNLERYMYGSSQEKLESFVGNVYKYY